MENIEKREIAISYSDMLVNDVFNTFGGCCEEVLEYVVEQTVVRLVHVMASIRHHEREIDDVKVYDEVAKMLHTIEKNSPGTLNLILQEYRAKESTNARH
jgi:hypothetical protein